MLLSLRLAEAEWNCGQRDEACDSYVRSMSLCDLYFPDEPDFKGMVLIGHGYAQMSLGRDNEALQLFDQAKGLARSTEQVRVVESLIHLAKSGTAMLCGRSSTFCLGELLYSSADQQDQQAGGSEL